MKFCHFCRKSANHYVGGGTLAALRELLDALKALEDFG